MSLGFGGKVASADSAVQTAISNGVVCVIAAGNDNVDACTNSPGRVSTAITVSRRDVVRFFAFVECSMQCTHTAKSQRLVQLPRRILELRLAITENVCLSSLLVSTSGAL